MNVNQHAERVLFSENLDEKLRLSSETVEFAFQQPRFGRNPPEPGRPDSLQLTVSPDSARADFPSRPSLVNDRSRGILLHFFANHELLAAELMALALLKFPDAPEKFRRGLFATMREEQKHTLWHLGRMKECGVALGEFPVNRFFWDAVSTMETPFDYVSRLSLTFEQANLDYARHFAALLNEAGDARTARILEKIYQDEISHVNYGLHWFRKWKDKKLSDWEAYCGALTFPLSPSRAKGNRTNFNRAGRLESGLDEDFVRHLDVFEKSKGRTPRVFYFNPDAEDHIADPDRAASPSPKVSALAKDLEILMLFAARKDDVLMLRNPASLEHLERLKGAGFQLPEIANAPIQEGTVADPTLLDRKVNRFVPWSVSPQLTKQFMRFDRQTDTDIGGGRLWKEQWRPLFSKTSQARWFAEWMGPAAVCKSREDVAAALANFENDSPGGFVLKIPTAAAGRGLTFHADAAAAESAAEVLLRTRREILVEPAHSRVFDFSAQYEIGPDKITKIGLIRQFISSGGRYRGSVSCAKFCKELPEELAMFLMDRALPAYEVNAPFAEALFRWMQSLQYTGPVGVDAYLHRGATGELRHRVVCEINSRFTMGRIAHEIRRQIAPGHSVKLVIKSSSELDLPTESPSLDARSGLIKSGQICLNEISSSTQFAAVITVDKAPSSL